MLKPECEQGRAAWPIFLKSCTVLVDTLDRELQASHGLPLTWFDVLIQLSESTEGRLPMNQLAGSVLLSKSGVTRLIDRMVVAGLIQRDSCPSDRRVVYATITTKGRSISSKAGPFLLRRIEHHFASHITSGEAEVINTALTRVLYAASVDFPARGSSAISNTLETSSTR